MENLKIKVNSEAESKEAQELFFEFGYEWRSCGKKLNCNFDFNEWDLCTEHDFVCMTSSFDKNQSKEITLPQLHDLVVLKRNSIEDATHIDRDGEPWFASSDNKFHSWADDHWAQERENVVSNYNPKPIEKPMKEWLNTETYEYKKAVDMGGHSKWIEIPKGAIKLVYSITNNNHYHFVNNKNKLMSLDDINNNDGYWYGNAEEYISSFLPSVVWQRHTQPEELPFIDDEPSLNDQYAEIEKVRQSKIDETLAERQAQYGCFEDVAFVTESIMGILSKVRGNGLQDLPNAHRMALYMIASKMARIVNGDFNHLDSWHDIGGYAKLIEKLIEGE